jgi:hypothetical protein
MTGLPFDFAKNREEHGSLQGNTVGWPPILQAAKELAQGESFRGNYRAATRSPGEPN